MAPVRPCAPSPRRRRSRASWRAGRGRRSLPAPGAASGPLALLAHRARPEEAAELGRRDSALTHSHPVCRDSVAAFVVAASRAIARGGEPEAAYEAALAWARSAAVAPVTEALVRAAAEAPRCDEGHLGWVLITRQNAFHE